MGIKLDSNRLEYRKYFDYYNGRLDSLWNIPPTLINGFQLVTAPNDLKSNLNYFNASSKFYINGILDNVPPELNEYFALLERMVTHWSVTGEYCLVIENGVINTIRPDYVFPIRRPDNRDVIQGFYFIFPAPDETADPSISNFSTSKARVIHYDILTGVATQTTRDIFSNELEEVSGGTPVNIQGVIWEDTGGGYYNHIEGMVRELNVRFALLQLALNSTAIPLLQIATEGMGGGLLGADGITPVNVAGLGKSGLGLVVPPPFTGEEGARYVERAGTGLEEALAYIRMILGSLAVMSGVPEYVYGVSLTQSSAEVERIMFMGQSRINRVQRAIQNTFAQLGITVEFQPLDISRGEPDVE
ncbi:hypothetical protein F4X10_24045 [Candidatus Poribacteria bacterium]|nr:hypothetical protein [Candidatus Poribacteria bacterium]